MKPSQTSQIRGSSSRSLSRPSFKKMKSSPATSCLALHVYCLQTIILQSIIFLIMRLLHYSFFEHTSSSSSFSLVVSYNVVIIHFCRITTQCTMHKNRSVGSRELEPHHRSASMLKKNGTYGGRKEGKAW
jgi:hypothetical protein